VDPLVAIAIGLWVLPRTWILLRDTTHILLQGLPRGLNLDAVRTEIAALPGMLSVHDLHVWSVAGDDASLTADVVLSADADHNAVRMLVGERLEADFAIHHSTIQTELEACEDAHVLHP
jgi:cobalt-zinc-cadmium efflux system protein